MHPKYCMEIMPMRKIYYLTRTYLPEKTGGVLMRARVVELLIIHGFEVIVVTPEYSGTKLEKEVGVKRIKYKKSNFSKLMERLGIIEDYLDKWVKDVYNILVEEIGKEDILFATSGGELSNIKLASMLKKNRECRFVVNFRDPLDYSLVNGLKLDSKFHVSRERQEELYLSNADLIITSSKVNQLSLKQKYPKLTNRINNNYFGFMKKFDMIAKTKSSNLRIAYGGAFTDIQSPELLAEALDGINGIEAYFIGNYQNYKPIQKYLKQFNFIPFLSHNEYLKFMMENIDVGFVSLSNDYLGACVPSKVYEYINLGLPMIGALPKGDAMDILNNNNYGIACLYSDIDSVKKGILTFKEKDILSKYRDNIIRDRNSWAMEERIKEVITWLKDL